MAFEKWIKEVGGIKQAIAWCADFSNFLFWDTLEHYCAKHLKEDDRLIDSELSQQIQRLFPDTNFISTCKLDQLENAWNEFVEFRRDKGRRYVEVTSHLPNIGLRATPAFTAKVFGEFENICNATGIMLGELADLKHFLPKITRDWEYCSAEEARYFAARAIRFRCQECLSSKVASSIQSQTDILNEHIAEKRRISELEYLKQDYRLESSRWIKAHELVSILGAQLKNPFAMAEEAPAAQSSTSGLLLSYLAVLGALRPARSVTSQSYEIAGSDGPLMESDEIGAAALSDDEIIEIASEYENHFSSLWNGDWKSHYGSSDKALKSVIFTLAKYTKEYSQIERLFLGLALVRPEWSDIQDVEGSARKFIAEALRTVKVQYGRFPQYKRRRKYLADRKRLGSFLLLGDRVNSEYCLSMIYGFPIGNTGLDTLFGGGGLFLYDEPRCRREESKSLPGRITLIRGGFGSGKTSLSLSLGAANAQTGGLSVYFALESGFGQLAYCLQRLGFQIDDSRFRLFENFEDAYDYLRAREQSYKAMAQNKTGAAEVDVAIGAFVIVPVEKEEIQPIPSTELLEKIERISQLRIPGFTRMVLVDPLNALDRNFEPQDEQSDSPPEDSNSQDTLSAAAASTESANESQTLEKPSSTKQVSIEVLKRLLGSESKYNSVRRRRVLKSLQVAAELGTNLVLISEEDDSTWTSFGEDIADTVIKLGGPIETVREGDAIFGQTFRTLNISKSRYQKEHPGTHPFKIVSGEGIRVFCTTETRLAIDSWRSETHLVRARFGVAAIDERLDISDTPNPDCGRVICLQGKLGTYKTQLGTCFIQALREEGPDAVGLVISMRYGLVDILNKIKDPFCVRAFDSSLKQISYQLPYLCQLPQGDNFPDEIIRAIKEQFDKANRQGKKIRRVLLDNPGEWEDLCPMLQKDPIFASTLISFLRKRGARILVTNRMLADSSKVIRAILEQVETSIHLDSIKLGQHNVNTLQIVKSKNMTHDPQKLEIASTDSGMQLRPVESFSQFDPQGRVVPTKVKILTRKQTSLSKSYWTRTSSLLRASMPSVVQFEETSSFGHRFAFGLASESAFDSLNIVEIDEHEMQREGAMEALTELPFFGGHDAFEPVIMDCMKNLDDKGRRKVVPFFNNSSCLLFDNTVWNQAEVTWESIAQSAWQWNRKERNEEQPRTFFTFPMSEPENWNCLFFEIFASCIEPELSADWLASVTSLSQIFSENSSVWPIVLWASELFRKLVHDEYMRVVSSGSLKSNRRFDSSEPSAVVSRQWFTTLQQTLREMRRHEDNSRKESKAQLVNEAAASSSEKPYSVTNYRVRRLPGRWSVAGHWYLGILKNSVSKPAGIKFLEFLTSPEANADRLRVGVGLPVHQSHGWKAETYSANWPCHDSEFFQEVACKYICRSRFRDYLESTSEMTRALQSIARISDEKSSSPRINEIWKSFARFLVERPRGSAISPRNT